MNVGKICLWPVLLCGVIFLGACGGGGGGGSSAPPSGDDTTPPVFSSMVPANGAPGVNVNTSITMTFNESLRCSTVNSSTVSLTPSPSGPAVAGAVSCSGANITFDPTNLLSPLQAYTFQVTGISDLAGNALASPVTKGFTTGAAADAVAPTVGQVTPADNATGVALGAKVSASFSEALNPSAVSVANFTLRDGSVTVPASVRYVGGTNFTAELVPGAQLAVNTVYTATLTTGLTDLAGNHLAANYSWSFTTAAVDASPPAVTSTVPAANVNYADAQAAVTVAFNEAPDSGNGERNDVHPQHRWQGPRTGHR